MGLLLAGAAALLAQPEELSSRHVTVLRPRGAFARTLIKVGLPAGDDWRRIEDARSDFALSVPTSTKPDVSAAGSRVLLVPLTSDVTRPRPLLRMDLFPRGPDDPSEVDEEYVEAFAEEYPQAAFQGKFTVTDSALLVLNNRTRLAMIGGTYLQGAAPAVRFQFVALGKQRHHFVTFDCAQKDWDRYAEAVAAIVLSLEVPRKR